MAEVLIRRNGSLIDVSPDGISPLDPALVQVLTPLLTYEHKTVLRGHARYSPDGQSRSVDIETKYMYALEGGRLVAGFGFLTPIVNALRQRGVTAHYIDMQPPADPSVYVPDWDNVRRHITFRAKQEECLQCIAANPYGIVNATMGFGKAQPLRSRVVTPDGWREIGSIAVGDYVSGLTGRPTQVRGVYPQGLKDIVTVSFSDGTEVQCCTEHLWTVQEAARPKTSGWQTLTAAQLSAAVRDKDGQPRWRLPISGAVDYVPLGACTVDPYLLGCLLCCGTVGDAITFSVQQPWLLADITSLAASGGLAVVKIDASRHQLAVAAASAKFTAEWGQWMFSELQRLLALGGIPQNYQRAAVAVRRRLLQGAMDAAGTMATATLGPLRSRQLVDDLCETVRGLGGVATVRVTPDAVGAAYSIEVGCSQSVFAIPRNPNRGSAAATKEKRDKLITAITPAGRQECVCISVAAANGLYLTDGYTVTHNTFIFEALAHLYPRATFDIVVRPTNVARRILRQLTRSVPNVGMHGDGDKYYGPRVNIYTAASCHHSPGTANFLLVDEVHQLATEEAMKALGQTWRYSRNFGFSGTPFSRGDGAHAQLTQLFGQEIFKLTYAEAVRLGLVVPIRVRWIPIRMPYNPVAERAGVSRMRHGIWRNAIRNEAIAADVRANYPDPNTQILILTATVEHAVMLWQYLPEFAMCAGQSMSADEVARYKRNHLLPDNFVPMSAERREELQERFGDGTIKRVIATDVWATGTDFSQLQVLYRADARGSEIISNQGPGRVSRLHEGKTYGEVIDCYDTFDTGFQRASDTRRSQYKKLGWEQLRPTTGNV